MSTLLAATKLGAKIVLASKLTLKKYDNLHAS
jgi:hypothetical protein